MKAIAQPGDASLLPRVLNMFTDNNQKVRYSAAAAVIRLTKNEEEQDGQE